MVALGRALRRAAVIVVALLLASLLAIYWTQTRSAGTGASGRDLSSVKSLGSDEDGKAENEGKKVTICHRTASDQNPYVRIRVSERAVKAHRRHPPKHGRRDVIPAPQSGCPGSYGSG
jgi:hypothetical protein